MVSSFPSAARWLTVLAALSLPADSASAQVAVGVTQGQNVSGNTGDTNASGILIDAQGVVRPAFAAEKAGRLNKKRAEAFVAEHLHADTHRPSPLRKVSLVRLEQAIQDHLARDENLPADMDFLAGLQRIDYVFVYPETGDLVIAGPAEGFAPNAVGRMVGVSSGRPTLRLDDLLVALRALERGGKIGCSIDPAPERMAAFQRYVAANSTPTTRAGAQARYRQMANILGDQEVSVFGIPADTHFAAALVEADYRMKLLSIGLETVPVRGFRSHLAMIAPGGNSTQRWWITPLYDAVYTTEDRRAFQLAGQRAQLLSQEEMVDMAGRRSDAAFTRLSTQKWAQLFTEKFPEIAEASPIFAELQNLIDLTVMAALLKKERLPQQVDWTMSLLLDAEKAPVREGNVPRQVATAFNTKNAGGRTIIGLVGGGVTFDPLQTVRRIEFKMDEGKRLGGIRTGAATEQPPEEHPWWWD